MFALVNKTTLLLFRGRNGADTLTGSQEGREKQPPAAEQRPVCISPSLGHHDQCCALEIGDTFAQVQTQ